MAQKVFIIAEAGVNHNGDVTIAKKMIEVAASSGVDCIKFQTFKAEKLVTKNAEMAEYQKENMTKESSQYQMLKELELTSKEFTELKKHCILNGIEFLSTAFDLDSIDFLEDLGVSLWKIPSGEITNLPYLEKIAQIKRKTILSTGMCTMDEVRQAVSVFRKNGLTDITLLHCTTDYPTDFSDVNLNAMLAMKSELGFGVGYSDHTIGIEVPIAAVALGATVIEKHFTLDRNMEGPDHLASIEPDGLVQMVKGIRNIEKSMGSKEKKPTDSELKNIKVARKSIVAMKDISKGELFTTVNLDIKRPGTGLSPMKWYDVLGQNSNKDYKEGELISL